MTTEQNETSHLSQENSTESNMQEPVSETQTDASTDNTVTEDVPNQSETIDYEAKMAELNDKYLRLYSEFDNYRKRTIKEKSDTAFALR